MDDCNWESMSMRQLRLECRLRGIDFTACYDKADIIDQLRAAATATSPIHSVDSSHQPRSSNRSTMAANETHALTKPSSTVIRVNGTSDRNIGDEHGLEIMSMGELKQRALLGGTLSDCNDKLDMVGRLRAGTTGPICRAGSGTSGLDTASAEENRISEAACTAAELRTARVDAEMDVRGTGLSTVVVVDKAWKDMSMCELRRECRLQNVESKGCFTKAELITRLYKEVGSDCSGSPDHSGRARVSVAEF